MGEKQRRLQRLLATQPMCIYCGGQTRADSIDHMPPIIMFDQRYRPRGMEYPACTACNSGGRLAEQAAAMMGRMYPDARTPEQIADLEKVLQAVQNNQPALLLEMQPSAVQRKKFRRDPDVPPDTHPLNARGPLLSEAMRLFGAKLGFALHYEFSRRIVPPGGGVAVRWFSNHEAIKGDIPSDFISFLGSPRTLRQGKFEVSDQFQWAGATVSDASAGAYFAAFRSSFAIAAFVHWDRAALRAAPDDWTCAPGFLIQ